jgi:RHS repeat-associated protein
VQQTYAYTYDDVGNRLSMSIPYGGGAMTHVYGYDRIYQLTDVNYPPDLSYLATDTTFAYDPADNRASVTDDAGTCTYTTNNLNQYTAAGTVSYTYDDNGNLTNDGTNTYSYDAENRLLTATKIPEALAGACDNPGLAFTTGGAANWFAQTSQSYYGGDAAQSGSIGHAQETWLQTTVSDAGTLVFWWKVSSQSNKDWLEFYLDGSLQSGRISGTVDWQQKSYPITGAGSHTLKWRYVKDGSKTSGSDCGWVDYVQWSGTYPNPNPTWETISYTYDAAGRRVAKAVDGQATTWYVYDGDHCIAEYDGSNQLLRKYVFGPRVDEPVCLVEVADSNGPSYYQFDGLGSVIALMSDSGDLAQFYEYSVYGQVGVWQPNHPNRFMFTGREFDQETGLYYYRARYYNPQIGRFLQTDPIGYGDGLNLYAYCDNNPLNYADPLGLCKKTSRPGFHSAEEVRLLMALIARDMILARVYAGKFGQYALGFVLHGPLGLLDTKIENAGESFEVPGVKGSGPDGALTASEFGNYMAGFSGGLIGGDGYVLVRAGGHGIAGMGQAYAAITGSTPEETISDAPSIPFINAGARASREYPQLPIRVPLPLPKR